MRIDCDYAKIPRVAKQSVNFLVCTTNVRGLSMQRLLPFFKSNVLQKINLRALTRVVASANTAKNGGAAGGHSTAARA
jgi:hypothetical protein